MNINLQFTSVSDLRYWLKRKADECGDPESYNDWLSGYFDEGNSITAHGEEYDYWSCWELL